MSKTHVMTTTEERVQAITNLDLDRFICKMQKDNTHRGLNWSEERATNAAKWYKRFLILGVKYPGFTLVPNEDIDEMWHAHVLDMKNYDEDTKRIFGKPFIHRPIFGDTTLMTEFKQTGELMFREFGEHMDQVKGYNPSSCSGNDCGGGNAILCDESNVKIAMDSFDRQIFQVA